MTTYEYRKAHGICTRCGRVPARPGRIMCQACAVEESDVRREKYHAAHPGPSRAGRSPMYIFTLTADDGTVFFRGLARDFIIQHGGSSAKLCHYAALGIRYNGIYRVTREPITKEGDNEH